MKTRRLLPLLPALMLLAMLSPELAFGHGVPVSNTALTTGDSLLVGYQKAGYFLSA